MSTVANEPPRTADLRGYLPIGIETLVPTVTLDFNLFIRPDPKGSVIKYRERSYPLKARDLERLIDSGVETLYIDVGSHTAYCKYLDDEVLNNDEVPVPQRYLVLQSANRAVFETAFHGGNVDQLVGLAGKFGHRMTDLICNQGAVIHDLLPLMTHDYYTYTHVTNVCTYCLALAARLGIRSQSDLIAIASGALLHDLGKREIAPAVLNQPGRLSGEQWELLRRHPTDGFRALCLRDDLSFGQLMMVYQHHEQPDGLGYPVGLVDSEIHAWARICKVADVFDALSTDRPYRKAEPVDRVLQFLTQRIGTAFDREIVQCLRAMITSKS